MENTWPSCFQPKIDERTPNIVRLLVGRPIGEVVTRLIDEVSILQAREHGLIKLMNRQGLAPEIVEQQVVDDFRSRNGPKDHLRSPIDIADVARQIAVVVGDQHHEEHLDHLATLWLLLRGFRVERSEGVGP